MIILYADAKQRLIDDPDIFKSGEVVCALVSDNYVPSQSDTLNSIRSNGYIISDNVTLNQTQTHLVANNVFFSCSNIIFTNVQVGAQFGSIVLYDDDGLLLAVHDVEGLPAIARGGNIELSISTGRNKLFGINALDEIVEGNSFVITHDLVGGVPQPTNAPYRHGRDIHRVEAAPKKNLTGRRGIYKDLSMFGTANPLTGDISVVADEHAISQSLRTILLTSFGERPFSSMEVAGDLNSWLFETIDYGIMSTIETTVQTKINNYEKRVIIRDVTVKAYPELGRLGVTIQYEIKASNATHTFSLLLDRA